MKNTMRNKYFGCIIGEAGTMTLRVVGSSHAGAARFLQQISACNSVHSDSENIVPLMLNAFEGLPNTGLSVLPLMRRRHGETVSDDPWERMGAGIGETQAESRRANRLGVVKRPRGMAPGKIHPSTQQVGTITSTPWGGGGFSTSKHSPRKIWRRGFQGIRI
jgi:hypothetical protein